jgi:hypothetical protein
VVQDPPPGIDTAFDNAALKLSDQLKRVDQVNGRAGGTVVAAVAIGGFFLSGMPAQLGVRWGVIALLVVTTGIVGVALWPIRWRGAPDPRAFASLANRTPARMHQAALATLLAAYDINTPLLRRKAQLANLAAAVEACALALLVIGRAAWG